MRNHYVPAAYLKAFSSESARSTVWAFDKEQKRFFNASVHKLAREHDFYSDADEEELAQLVEAPANRILAKLRKHQPLDSRERTWLAYYMGVFLMRVPERRKQALVSLPEVVDETVSEIVTEIRRLASEGGFDQELVEQRLREAEGARSKFKEQPPASLMNQIRAPWPSRGVVTAISQMNWRFAVTDGPILFLTTDNPVFFFSAYGLGTANSELSFPIGSHLALMGTRSGDDDGNFLKVNQQMVKEVNRRLASEATRFLFYHEQASWIRTLAGKRRPYLSRIVWQ